MYWPGDALDCYLNPSRGAISERGGRFAWKEWLEFDPIALAPQVRVPLRVVTSEQTATRVGAKRLTERLQGSVEIVWGVGAQFDFYDNAAIVEFAATNLVSHFKTTLS